MKKILECVPNFSEGRNRENIAKIVAPFKGKTDLRLLDTQRDVFEQQDALVSTEARVAQELVSLYKALGGGWDFDAAQPDPTSETATEAAPGPTP